VSSRGYIKLYRSLFKHEFFRQGKFSEREAFTWMIAEAAWKPRNRRVGQFFVDLDRGELVASLRHLAEIWGWEVGAVRGYLGRCEKVGMLSTRSNNGITIVTVCNYDVYQGEDGDDDKGADKVQAQGQQGHNTGPARDQHKTEEGKKVKKEEGKEDPEGGLDLLAGSGAGLPVLFAPPKRARAAPRHLLDPNWKPSDDDWNYAAGRGFQGPKIEQLAEAFRNNHVGKGTMMAKVSGYWRTWIGNEIKWHGEPGAAGAGARPAARTRSDTAIEGMFSSMTEEDLDGRRR
jgi:hypothetical protein